MWQRDRNAHRGRWQRMFLCHRGSLTMLLLIVVILLFYGSNLRNRWLVVLNISSAKSYSFDFSDDLILTICMIISIINNSYENQSSFFSLSSHHMNHQSSPSPPPPAAVKSTNSLAILVLLQGSSHESHCTILVPHLQVDDKGATDEEGTQELMLLLF